MTKKPPSILLMLLLAFPQISETIYTPSLPDIARDLHTSATLVEWTLSIYFVGFALGVFFWGLFCDKKGRRLSILYGLVTYFLGCLGCFLSSSIYELLCWRFIQAFGASTGSVTTQTILRDLFQGKERSRFFSMASGVLAFAPAIGPLLGGGLDLLFGWQSNFLFLLTLSVALLSCAFCWLYETKKSQANANDKEPSIAKTATKILLDRKIWSHALLIGGCNGILFGFYAEAPFIFISVFKLNSFEYGYLGILIALASVIAARISYKMNSHRSPYQIINTGCLTCLIGSILGVLTSFFFYEAALFSIPFLVYCSSFFIIFIGIGLIIPNTLSQALANHQESLGIAGATFGLLYYILIAIFIGLLSAVHTNDSLTLLPLYALLLSIWMFFDFKTSTKVCFK